MKISYEILKTLEFRPWDAIEVDETTWVRDTPDLYDNENKCWFPSYRITVKFKDNEWTCIAWYNDETNKKNKIFKRVTAENIETIEDIQKVIDICRINIKLL